MGCTESRESAVAKAERMENMRRNMKALQMAPYVPIVDELALKTIAFALSTDNKWIILRDTLSLPTTALVSMSAILGPAGIHLVFCVEEPFDFTNYGGICELRVQKYKSHPMTETEARTMLKRLGIERDNTKSAETADGS